MSPEAVLRSAASPRGMLVAVVGPSGAGKDTLISRAQAALAGDHGVRFARRIVTRDAQAESEDHDSLDEAAFRAAEAQGEFSLDWSAHGLRYALPRSAYDDVAAGALVVANISRRHLARAVDIFGRVAVAEVTAPADLLVARIVARGREDEPAARQRVMRQVDLAVPAGICARVRIDNSGDLDRSVDAFLEHLARCRDLCR